VHNEMILSKSELLFHVGG